MSGYTETDGVIFQNWRMEGDQLVRTATQPSRRPILQQNAELRKNPDALRSMSFMGLELNIPELDYYRLIKIDPDLAAPDGEIRLQAWQRFLASSDSDPYRVRVRRKGRA